MQLKATLQSTAVALSAGVTGISAQSIFLPDLSSALCEEFRFVTRPETAEQFAAPEGLKFGYGRGDGFAITALTLFADGIHCQAPAPTDDLRHVIERVLRILAECGAFVAEPDLRWLFNSQVEVQLDCGFSIWLDQLRPVAEAIRSQIESYGIPVNYYEPTGIAFGGEGADMIKPGRFTLERRVGFSFEENVFFSEAPVSSAEHLVLLQEIEQSFDVAIN